MKRALLALSLVSGAAFGHAYGHGGTPQVVDIQFPPQTDGPWLIDNLGLFEGRASGYAWLCDDAVNLLAGIDWLAPVDQAGDVWVVSTRAGLYRTADRGCSFTSVADLADHVTGPVLPHPEHPLEVITGTETLGLSNDVYLSEDGGQTWSARGLAVDGRVRSMLRATADPDVVYVSHADGASRSDDGGRTFAPLALGPMDIDPVAAPEEFKFLATHPAVALEVYAIIERFPDSYVVRSMDGGGSWSTLSVLPDTPDGLIVEGDGRLLATTPFEGVLYSEDDGSSWVPRDTEAAFLSCLTQAPDGRIWSCARGMPRPWLVASTGDFGLTWRAELDTYDDLSTGWGCATGTPTANTCDRQCNPADLTCAEAPDGGAVGGVDVGPDGGSDAGVQDAGVDADETPLSTQPGGGCTSAPAPFLWCLLPGLLVFRRRQL